MMILILGVVLRARDVKKKANHPEGGLGEIRTLKVKDKQVLGETKGQTDRAPRPHEI